MRRFMAEVGAPGERYTVAEAGAIYIEHLDVVMERKRSTIADYRGYLGRHLGPFFGGRPIDKIDRARVESYLLAKKRDGLSSKTIANHLTFLHGLWSFAVKRKWVARNVVALVDRPRPARFKDRRIRLLAREELEALLRAVPDDPLGAVERPLYLCAAMTGLRQGELIALRWCDVDWSASRVRVADNFVRATAAARFRWPTVWPASSSATSRPRAGALRTTSSSPPAHGPRPRRLEAAQALQRGAAAWRAAAQHLPRPAPHLRHADGRGRSADPRDPGVDGPRRHLDDRDLRPLRAESDRWRGVRPARVRDRPISVARTPWQAFRIHARNVHSREGRRRGAMLRYPDIERGPGSYSARTARSSSARSTIRATRYPVSSSAPTARSSSRFIARKITRCSPQRARSHGSLPFRGLTSMLAGCGSVVSSS